MYLDCEKYLLQHFTGTIDETLEKSLQQYGMSTDETVYTYLFGFSLPVDEFLLSKEEAARLVLLYARQQWGQLDLFTYDYLQSLKIDMDVVAVKLEEFFNTVQGEQAMMHYLSVHHELTFASFISMVYGREMRELPEMVGLQKIYMFPIDERYLVHPIFEEQSLFWQWLFVKKIYSILSQVELQKINHVTNLFAQFKQSAVSLFVQQLQVGHADFLKAIDQLVALIDQCNVDYTEKKSIYMQRFICHFQMSTRGETLHKFIEELRGRWLTQTQWLTEQEKVLITYVEFLIAYQQQQTAKVIQYARVLLGQEQLTDYAVEIMLNYPNVLPNKKPTSDALVKSYEENFLEQLFYIVIDALVKQENYEEAFSYIKEYNLASCEAIFACIHHQDSKEYLYMIEATIQRDIAYIVDQSPQNIRASLEVWHANFQEKTSTYNTIAYQTSKHVCNLMKVLFVAQYYDLFERLMELYKKYIMIDEHFEEMGEFLQRFVKAEVVQSSIHV